MDKYIVFDFGGTKIKHGISNDNGELITSSSYDTTRDNLDRFLADLYAVIDHYIKEHKVAGIGISMPGYIDIYTGYAERAGAIVALDGQNIKEILEQKYGLPVEVENDGNCAALAEKMAGNATDVDNFIVMTIGTGIGGGFVFNGEIYRGYRFRAGEFGMMVTHLADGTKKDMHHTAATSALIEEYKRYKNIEGHVEGTEIFAAAQTDPEVKALIDRWIGHIARGIYNLTVTLNPEKILIGGGVSANPYLLEEINRQMKDFQYWSEFAIPIERCKFLNDAGLIGAFYHFKIMREKVRH